MWDEEDRARRIRLLEAVGLAQAAEEPLDVAGLAADLEMSEPTVRIELEQLHGMGLCLHGLEEGLAPMLLDAGRQFLSLRGEVDGDVLHFLPRVIDDLHAREALLTAGTILVDEFRAALLGGHGVDHARELVPAAFGAAVDERLTLDLFAATVALLARLSNGAPAGCVAEEIISVALMDEARVWLESAVERGFLDEDAAEAASGELRGLFELFEDDDVLNLLEMEEPADAALAGHDPINRQLGVADQRVEAWFDPFGGTAPTGHLHERARRR
jgi:hypothetical protein